MGRFQEIHPPPDHCPGGVQEPGIDFVSYQENIDTSSPLGGAIFTIISAVAQLERDIIAERVQAGLRKAWVNGIGLVW